MSRKIRWLAGVLAALAAPAAAQAGWVVRTDSVLARPLADRVAHAEAALDSLHARGRLGARVEAVQGDTLVVRVGAPAVVSRVDLQGLSALDPAAVQAGWRTRPGGRYVPADLATDLAAAAARYARAGYPDARLVPAVALREGGRAVDLVVRVEEGAPAALAGVELVGGRRPARAFASRVTGVAPGAPLADLDAPAVRQSLWETGLYAEVGEPVVARTAGGDLVVQVPVREAPPGTFDLVLGYLPPAQGSGGGVVGTGRVHLRNLFGGGRAADLALVRTPGLVSSLDVAVRDPFVLGSPLGLGAHFAGGSRDSTFSRQRVGLDLTYALGGGLALVGSLSRETVRPGAFGSTLVDGQPRVARSDALYLGVGVTLRRLDDARAPRRGVALAVAVEQGRPAREAGAREAVAEASTLRRLTAEARVFVPLGARPVAVLGLDARVAQRADGARYDEADLFRFGGAASLRGYDEDAVVGRAVGRAFVEARLALDAESFAFAFGDLGAVDRPALADRPAERRLLPGYGLGLRVRTGVGLASVSYALNPDLPVGRGKVHVGLAVGL